MTEKKTAYQKKATKRINDVFREEYEAGRKANRDGEHQDSNPHPTMLGQSGERQAWYNGWFDEWREAKWGA